MDREEAQGWPLCLGKIARKQAISLRTGLWMNRREDNIFNVDRRCRQLRVGSSRRRRFLVFLKGSQSIPVQFSPTLY